MCNNLDRAGSLADLFTVATTAMLSQNAQTLVPAHCRPHKAVAHHERH